MPQAPLRCPPGPTPELACIEISGQNAVLTFFTFAGQQSSLEYSADLSSGSWTARLGGNVTGTGEDVSVTDSLAGASGSRFYRLKQR